MLLLSVFCVIGMTMASVANVNLQQCENCRNIMDARLAAESGLAFMLDVLEQIRLPGTTTGETFCGNLRNALAAKLEGTANLQGGYVTNTGTSVFVPDIQVGGMKFCSYFTWLGQNSCRMQVKGISGSVTRNLTLDFSLEARKAAAFDYGLASRGQITISGNAKILGVNNPTEANIISTTALNQDAICVGGNSEVSGDLFTARENAGVVISGNPQIAGSTNPAVIAEHVHEGAAQPDFPEIDVTPIAALATYTLQPNDSTNKGVLNNVRIPAGMNPRFNSDIVLNGVVYIESPNVVQFEGKCTVNGILVTQKSSEAISVCQLKFDGHVEANGVEALPNTPEFASAKQQTGTFILAPGFGVTFGGNVTAVGGSIAADQLIFSGTAEGTIAGAVIGLADFPTNVGGNVEIHVDRTNAPASPAGFVKPFVLKSDADSYSEVLQ
jgi:hypothetical protein